MSSFTALNIDYNDKPGEDDVDDIKEIQIEEALKLYQVALKLHSLGPTSYLDTEEAYQQLLESDIFLYPESQSEYDRHLLYGDIVAEDELDEDDSEQGISGIPSWLEDSAPNTLPQILHLSFKNYGQFTLDKLVLSCRKRPPTQPGDEYELFNQVYKVFDLFSKAVDKDGSDLELWRILAQLSLSLGSPRVSRLCLETVMGSPNSDLGSIGLEERLGYQKLKGLLLRIGDTLSARSIKKKSTEKRRKSLISNQLMKKLSVDQDTFYTNFNFKRPSTFLTTFEPTHKVRLPYLSWAKIAELILESAGVAENDYISSCPLVFERPSTEPLETSSIYDRDLIVDTESPVEIQRVCFLSNAGIEGADGETEGEIETEGEAEEIRNSGFNPAAAPSNLRESSEPELHHLGTALHLDETLPKPPPQPITGSPTRKRSIDSVDVAEPAEGLRGRSKRIKAREDMIENLVDRKEDREEMELLLEQKFTADDALFSVVSTTLALLGVDREVNAEELRNFVRSPTSNRSSIADAVAEMVSFLHSSKMDPVEEMVAKPDPKNGPLQKILRNNPLGDILSTQKSTTALYGGTEDFQKPEIITFLARINASNLVPDQVAWELVSTLCGTNSILCSLPKGTNYLTTTWSPKLKSSITDLVLAFLPHFHTHMLDALAQCSDDADFNYNFAHISQSILELLLDSLSEADNSEKDMIVQSAWEWQNIASQFTSSFSPSADSEDIQLLALRLLWATTLLLKEKFSDSPSTVLIYLDDISSSPFLADRNVVLPNSRTMPNLSLDAVNRETRSIRMRDSIHLLCNIGEGSDPVSIIHLIEPLLDSIRDMGNDDEDSELDSPSNDVLEGTAGLEEMKDLIKNLTIEGKLSLRIRLINAYKQIDYVPMVISNYLQCLDLVVEDMKGTQSSFLRLEERQSALVWSLTISSALVENISLYINEYSSDPFETVDLGQLRRSLGTVFDLCCILHSRVIQADIETAGHRLPITRDKRNMTLFDKFASRLNDTEVRSWLILSRLFQEGQSQIPESQTEISDTWPHYLSALHESVGTRCMCKAADHILLKYLLYQFLELWPSDGSSAELMQVLFDIYGLSFSPVGLVDHTCPDLEVYDEIEPKESIKLVPFILSAVNELCLKDALKSDILESLELVGATIDELPAAPEMDYNSTVIKNFLSSPIKPLDVFNSLRGLGEIGTVRIPHQAAPGASTGWYFLRGNLELHQFQIASSRLGSAADTSILESAITSLLIDLQYSAEGWESWYQLAQAYECQLAECVSWSIEKINNNAPEIERLQRKAIHSYCMAVTCAVRLPLSSEGLSEKLASLYSGFALRLYDSSREPFSMKAFQVLDSEHRHCSSDRQGLHTSAPFTPMDQYTAWKLSSAMYKKSIGYRPESWESHYMYSKCLWKLFCYEQVPSGVDFMDVISSIIEAIDLTPARPRRDPVLEPHYRLLSVTYKLARRRYLEISEAFAILKTSYFSAKLSHTEPPTELEEWDGYALDFLKVLRSSDKENWHHRMTIRAAHVIYDDCRDEVSATGARHELLQQFFKKQMTINFWKTALERPGRHYVYASRYTRFMAELLDKASDKSNLEQLLRRMRKRTYEYYNHTGLWSGCVVVYVKLLRRLARVPESHEDTIFKNLPHEEWNVRSVALDEWCHVPGSSSILLDVMRDVIELKKLNAMLMKNTLMDDLLGDSYALLYSTIGADLDISPELVERVAATQEPHPPGTTAASSEHTWKPRAKGVGRREVHRRAEMAASRVSGGSLPSLAAGGIEKNAASKEESPRPGGVQLGGGEEEGNGAERQDGKGRDRGMDVDSECDAGEEAVNGLSTGVSEVRLQVPEDDSDNSLSELDEDEDEFEDARSGFVGVEAKVEQPEVGREEGMVPLLFPKLVERMASTERYGEEGVGEVGDEVESEGVVPVGGPVPREDGAGDDGATENEAA